MTMLGKRAGVLCWVASGVYVAAMMVGALVTGRWILRFWNVRGDYVELLGQSGDVGMYARLALYAPILLGVAALIGVVLLISLYLRKTWALWVSLLAAPACLVGLFVGDRTLRSIEGVFYDKSKYVALYHKAGLVLAIGSVLFCAVVLVDLLVLGKKRMAAAPAAADAGDGVAR